VPQGRGKRPRERVRSALTFTPSAARRTDAGERDSTRRAAAQAARRTPAPTELRLAYEHDGYAPLPARSAVFENQRVVRAVLGDESSPCVDSSLEYALVRGTGEAEVVHVHGIVTAGDELLLPATFRRTTTSSREQAFTPLDQLAYALDGSLVDGDASVDFVRRGGVEIERHAQ
jgi:hypothetical protein